MRRASSTLVLGTIKYQKLNAHVVKLVNTLHSGCSELKFLEVRVFSWAQAIRLTKTGFFCFMTMNIAYLHTNPFHQEIENLIIDIVNNFHSEDYKLFEIRYLDLKCYKISKLIKVRRFIKENKIDVIHTFHYVDAYYAMMASRGMKVKVIYSCYSYHDDLSGFSKRIFKNVLKNVDAVIFQTDTHRNRMLSKYNINKQNVCKLFHAFSAERLDDNRYKSIRDEFFIDDFRYLIGTLGDFTPEHDVLNVFKMVKKLRKTGRNFTCIVAGDELEEYDSYFDDCKYYYLIQGLDNYITFAGRRNDSSNFVSQLDVFVYHSDNEAVAVPLIEAMLLGVNVVANDSEMIKEITLNGKYATLYESGNAVDFADKTRQIMMDLDDYKIIAETVKEECREIYSIERHVDGLKEIYTNVNN